jgi:photosystem II stability/assembly factor-like uncharacterized protein
MMNEQSELSQEDHLLEHTAGEDPVYALAASPNFAEDGLCFAVRSSGLYRSGDGGDTWHAAFEELDMEVTPTATSVVFSPDFVNDHMLFVGSMGGILRSIDAGRNWDIIALPSPPPLVSSMAISPNYIHDGTLFAGTFEDGIFCSADRGNHWVAWNFGLFDRNILASGISPSFEVDKTLYVGVESGVFRSANGGRAWREVGFDTDLAPVLSLAISPNYDEDGTLLVGTEANGLWISDDCGDVWKRIGEKQISGSVNEILISTKGTSIPELLVHDDDHLLFSPDLGSTWRPLESAAKILGEVTCVLVPEGLERMGLLLVGLVDGSVLRLNGPDGNIPS